MSEGGFSFISSIYCKALVSRLSTSHAGWREREREREGGGEGEGGEKEGRERNEGDKKPP